MSTTTYLNAELGIVKCNFSEIKKNWLYLVHMPLGNKPQVHLVNFRNWAFFDLY